MEYALVGAGGFAREVKVQMKEPNMKCFIDDFMWDERYINDNILPLSELDTSKYKILIAIGDPYTRNQIRMRLLGATFFTFIHPSAQLLGEVRIGEGSIVCAGSIITDNVTIGCHSHINLLSTIGHDCVIGDYFTTAPGAKISGNCFIGDRVYVGTNASVKEKIKIKNDVTIGMMAGVTNDINESGIYVGIPARKMNNKYDDTHII